MQNNDKVILESARAREIVQEILSFGVTDYQIQKIIQFLSLELEDMSLMKDLISALENNSDDASSKPRLQL